MRRNNETKAHMSHKDGTGTELCYVIEASTRTVPITFASNVWRYPLSDIAIRSLGLRPKPRTGAPHPVEHA